MRTDEFRTSAVVVIAFVASLHSGCGNGRERTASAAAEQPPATSAPVAKAAPPPIKACTVVNRAEVEALISHEVLEPVEETIAAELSVCSFGRPGSPMVHGRPMDRPVIVSVFTGGNGYYAGPVAQARELYEMAEKNAGEIDAVPGLGDKAHWTGTTLRLLRGPYMVEVEAYAGDSSRSIAEKLASLALGRLP
jgi:hypothetical protein